MEKTIGTANSLLCTDQLCTYCGEEIRTVDRVVEFEDGSMMHHVCAEEDGVEIIYDDEDEDEDDDEYDND